MTHRDAEQLDRIIGQMTEAEKRDLLERLARSLNGGQSQPASSNMMTPDQKRAVDELLKEVETLPCANEPDDGLIGSRDHDKILYDGSGRTGFPERPFK
jgi:hypothetical protein